MIVDWLKRDATAGQKTLIEQEMLSTTASQQQQQQQQLTAKEETFGFFRKIVIELVEIMLSFKQKRG